MSELPQRPARLTDDQQAEIVRLGIRQTSQAEIARQTGVQRKTVRRVLARQRAALTINEDLEQERAGAIEVYREIQRSAWEGIKQGRAPAGLLGEVARAQARIDTLMGLAPATPDDPALEIARFQRTVVGVIQEEAPEVAARITHRLHGTAAAEVARELVAEDMKHLSNDELRAIIRAGKQHESR